jgi:hypothetical protein
MSRAGYRDIGAAVFDENPGDDDREDGGLIRKFCEWRRALYPPGVRFTSPSACEASRAPTRDVQSPPGAKQWVRRGPIGFWRSYALSNPRRAACAAFEALMARRKKQH